MIEVATSKRALWDSTPLALDSPLGPPDTYAEVLVGFDLSALGLQPLEIPGEYGPETTVSELNYPRLSAAVKAALSGDVDFVSLDRNFHLDPARMERVASLDGLRGAEKLSNVLDTGGICIELPFDSAGIGALPAFLPRLGGIRTAAVRLTSDTDFAFLEKFADVAHKHGIRLMGIVDDVEYMEGNREVVTRVFDSVRLKVKDPQRMRALRFELSASAHAQDTKIMVYVELGIVVSATMQAARERAALIADITHEPLFNAIPFSIGTVYDVADGVEKWIKYGAADGIYFIPASMPTDLASILRGVIPLIKTRTRMDRNQI